MQLAPQRPLEVEGVILVAVVKQGQIILDNLIVSGLVHTADNPFCLDLMCPCHVDPDNLTVVFEDLNNGLFTPAEAMRLIMGRMV